MQQRDSSDVPDTDVCAEFGRSAVTLKSTQGLVITDRTVMENEISIKSRTKYVIFLFPLFSPSFLSVKKSLYRAQIRTLRRTERSRRSL